MGIDKQNFVVFANQNFKKPFVNEGYFFPFFCA